MTHTPESARLTDLMEARRLELGIHTWQTLADRAHISQETLRALRAGATIAPRSAYGLEQALQWAPGSIARVLSGGEPASARTCDVPARLAASMLADATANLDAYIEERAQAIAKTRIAQEKDRADRRIADVRGKLLAQLRRERDLTTELRRQLKPLIRHVEETCPATLERLRAELSVYTQSVVRTAEELDAERAGTRLSAIREAINAVTAQQIKDAATLADWEQQDHACGSWCGHGKTCHNSEAAATHERLLSTLRGLLSGEEAPR